MPSCHCSRFSIRTPVLALVGCIGCLGSASWLGSVAWADEPASERPAAWTKGDAIDRLRRSPHDPYLQFVVTQMCIRDGSTGEVGRYLPRAAGPRQIASERNRQINLYSIFSGSLAIQETLQLDTMLDRADGDRPRGDVQRGTVSLSELEGPHVDSHPWGEMLAGREPPISRLAECVPADQLFVRFRSVGRLLEARDRIEPLAGYVTTHSQGATYDGGVIDRLQTQLGLETHGVLKPFYNGGISEIAITASDLYFRDGTDMTVVMRLRHPDTVREIFDHAFAASTTGRAPAMSDEEDYGGVAIRHVRTADRTIDCYAANPTEDLHVRGNSVVGVRRVIDTILDRPHEGQRIVPLGRTDEFRYIRTLYALDSEQEDGLVYLSDPFVRHLIGAESKLTQRDRLVCGANLRMLGYASLLHRTQTGTAPESIQGLARSVWLGSESHPIGLDCPCGGSYTLVDSGITAVCSHHGRQGAMVACREIPTKSVSEREAAEYRAFVNNYSQYWRTFFDPIAIRVRLEPKETRVETVILPLIDNSIYQGLASVLGGDPELLDGLPVAKRNIFSVAARLDKQTLMRRFGFSVPEPDLPDDVEVATSNAALRIERQRMTERSLRAIGLAMHKHHDTFNALPARGESNTTGRIENSDAARPGTPGGPINDALSWRVRLLPFLEERELYHQFRLDEPWDSEHNRALISQMPDVYASAAPGLKDEGKTRFVMPWSASSMHADPRRGTRFQDVRDGLSNTIMAVVANEDRAVVWTRPEDLEIDLEAPRRGWFDDEARTASVLLATGGVQRIESVNSDEVIAALFTVAGSESVDPQWNVANGPAFTNPSRRNRFRSTSSVPIVQELEIERFLNEGIGNQIAFHVCDSDPPIDLSVTRMFGMLLSFGQNRGRGMRPEFGMIAMLAGSLNTPVYLSVPVRDAEVVDRTLGKLDEYLVRMSKDPRSGLGATSGLFGFTHEVYAHGDADRTGDRRDNFPEVRTHALRTGPLTWRFSWARIGNGLYVASKPFVLEDLRKITDSESAGERVTEVKGETVATGESQTSGETESPRKTVSAGEITSAGKAHGMVRVRPEHWERVLPHMRIGWSESERRSCQRQLSFLAASARAMTAARGEPSTDKELPRIRELTRRVFGAEPRCVGGGRYAVDEAGTDVCCTAHGCVDLPRQPAAGEGNLASFAESLRDVRLEMTFTPEGLHTVVTVAEK